MHHPILSQLDVSRETEERLNAYVELLKKWNDKINLVSRNTVADLWKRHIEDSAQLLLHTDPRIDHWLDLGSGGGLPGLVVAIIGTDLGRVGRVTMVESDGRKCAFLSEVVRALSLPVTVLNDRIESLKPQYADVVSARALADLTRLLELTRSHLSESSLLIFPKGANHRAEIERARLAWEFDLEVFPSQTDPGAAILKIRHPKKKSEG